MNTLVVPKNYIEIENNEMEYIDGGFDIISVKVAGIIFNMAFLSAFGSIGISGYISRYGVAQARRIWSATVLSRLSGWGCKKLAVGLGAAFGFAYAYCNPGLALAKYLDSGDYCPNNGWLSI